MFNATLSNIIDATPVTLRDDILACFRHGDIGNYRYEVIFSRQITSEEAAEMKASFDWELSDVANAAIFTWF